MNKMPEPPNPYLERMHIGHKSLAFDEGAKAKEELAIAEDWRKVPSVDSLAAKLARLIKQEEIYYVRPLAEELHRGLMEER